MLRMTLLAGALALAFTLPVQAADKPMAGPVPAVHAQELQNLVAKLKHDQRLGWEHDLRLASVHPGGRGQRLLRLNHTYKGVRVWGSQSIIATDDAGQVASQTVSDRRGHLRQRGAAVDVTPRLSPNEAIDAALDATGSRQGRAVEAPASELVLVPTVTRQRTPAAATKPESQLNALDFEQVVTGHVLAYVVSTRVVVGARLEFWDTLVSAQSGKVLDRISAAHNVAGTGYSQYNGTVPIETTLSDGVYVMKDSTRGTGGKYGGMAIVNANNVQAFAGTLFSNATNVWGDGQQYVPGGSTTGANGQTAAVNAMWGLMNTYDVMKNVLGWQSLDGNNTATYIAVHYGNRIDNAFYSSGCKCMAIGDGDWRFFNLGSIDVVGHEMGHGVTDATSGLIYAGESGGLNESSSDINGEMTEAYARQGGTGGTIPAGNDWVTGHEISRNGVPLRFMAKPSKDGLSVDAWYSGIASLNVHYSSGPNNRMFYFLSQGSSATVGNEAHSTYLKRLPKGMSGIGSDAAYRIWFLANTTQFTPSTNYADARAKVITAAQQLYGAGSKEEIAVKRAYAAINVGNDVDEIGYSSPVLIQAQPLSTAVTVGKTAAFSVTPEAGKAPYTYAWYKNGVRARGVTGPAYTFPTTAADQGAKVHVVVTDSSAVPTSVRSATATLTINPPGTAYERMSNGDFEQGTAAWSGSVYEIKMWSQATQGAPYQGLWSAWLGGFGSVTQEYLSNVVTIAPDATNATLSFALKIFSGDNGTTAKDTLVVSVRDAGGAVLGTLATYSNLDKANAYVIRSFDLLPYRGKTVQVRFDMTEDASLATSFVLDAVSVKTD